MGNGDNKKCVPARNRFTTFDGTSGVVSEDRKTRVEIIENSTAIIVDEADSPAYQVIAHKDGSVLVGGMLKTLRSDPELAAKIREAGRLAIECGDFEPAAQLRNMALKKLLPVNER
jgi:hypothetical protein